MFLGEQSDLGRYGENGTEGDLVPISDSGAQTYGLVVLSGTIVLVFLLGGCWLVLYIYRPDILEAITLFISGGVVVSIITY